MENTNEGTVVAPKDNEVEENLELPQVEEGTEDTTDWKAEAQKLREKAIAQREKTKSLKQAKAEAEAKLAELTKSSEKSSSPKTGELDETQLDYLDLKGITDNDEIEVIRKVMQRTGQTVRQALKDDYVESKLKSLRAEKETRAAMPSSTKRSSQGQTDDVEYWLAKNEQDGSLPDSFQLRVKVIEAKERRASKNYPAWRD